MSARALHIRGNRHPVTVDDARDSEKDYIMLWKHGEEMIKLYKQVYKHRDQIKALTRHHLQLRKETITIAPMKEWTHGTFNLCIPIEVKYSHACRKFMFRCPMPHKLAGTVNEKMGCELGAYVWMQEKCPDIRIPYLYGFGFSGSYYTHEVQRPWYIRLLHIIRRHLYRVLQRPILSRYIRHPTADIDFPISYMLLEFISPDIGQMLSQTWDKHRDDPSRRSKLFQSISRIILSLARIPQASIGSFQFNESGVITLTNRPLTSSIVMLENEGAERSIQSNQIYHSTQDFVADTMELHDNAFIQNPNGASDDDECRSHMAARAILRATSHCYIGRKQRNGPYFLQFTDLTRSNVFVDDDWKITCLLDLEWISALPIEMISVPHWLSGCDVIDGLTDKELDKFSAVRLEFMQQFKLEEDKMEMEHDVSLTDTINDIWTSGRVWFWYTMNTGSKTLYPIVETYIYSNFFPKAGIDEAEKNLANFWQPDATGIMKKKRKDYNGYIREFTKLVEEHGSSPSENLML